MQAINLVDYVDLFIEQFIIKEIFEDKDMKLNSTKKKEKKKLDSKNEVSEFYDSDRTKYIINKYLIGPYN